MQDGRCRLLKITGKWLIGLRKLPLRALHLSVAGASDPCGTYRSLRVSIPGRMACRLALRRCASKEAEPLSHARMVLRCNVRPLGSCAELRAVASVAAGVTWMRLEGADLLDHRLPQRLLGQCTGPRREGVVAQCPADIGTPSELPTGGAPGICRAVSERPVLTRPGGFRRVGRTRPLAPDWVARDRREKSGRAGRGYPAARRDGRRPASLVTRRYGVHRRVAACGSKGSEPGHKRGHNAPLRSAAALTKAAPQPRR